jgi:hypothetical protein
MPVCLQAQPSVRWIVFTTSCAADAQCRERHRRPASSTESSRRCSRLRFSWSVSIDCCSSIFCSSGLQYPCNYAASRTHNSHRIAHRGRRRPGCGANKAGGPRRQLGPLKPPASHSGRGVGLARISGGERLVHIADVRETDAFRAAEQPIKPGAQLLVRFGVRSYLGVALRRDDTLSNISFNIMIDSSTIEIAVPRIFARMIAVLQILQHRGVRRTMNTSSSTTRLVRFLE